MSKCNTERRSDRSSSRAPGSFAALGSECRTDRATQSFGLTVSHPFAGLGHTHSKSLARAELVSNSKVLAGLTWALTRGNIAHFDHRPNSDQHCPCLV